MNEDTSNIVIFDKADFLHRMMNDEELAVEIMSEYLVDMEEQLRRLKSSAETEEMSVLVRLAHTVKGASANVGAKEVQATALKAEKAAASANRPEFLSLVPLIESAFQGLKGQLKEIGFMEN